MEERMGDRPDTGDLTAGIRIEHGVGRRANPPNLDDRDASSTGLSRRSMLRLGLAAASAALQSTGSAGETSAHESLRNPILGQGGLHHVAIRTREWERTLRFYQDALGFTVKMAWKEGSGSLDEKLAANSAREEHDRWAYLDSGNGTCVEVFEDVTFAPPAPDLSGPTKNPGGPLVHLGLRTSRIDKVCEHVRLHGATDVGTPADFTLHTTTGQGPVVVRICFLRGPNGEWIELVQNAP